MNTSERPIINISATQARRQLQSLIKRMKSTGERFIVHRYGKPVMIMIPYSEYLALRAMREAGNLSEQAGQTE